MARSGGGELLGGYARLAPAVCESRVSLDPTTTRCCSWKKKFFTRSSDGKLYTVGGLDAVEDTTFNSVGNTRLLLAHRHIPPQH